MLLDGIATIKHCTKYIYLGVKIMGKWNPRGRHNKGKSAISELNSILWDKLITTKTNINKTIVNNTITYGSEIWQLKFITKVEIQLYSSSSYNNINLK